MSYLDALLKLTVRVSGNGAQVGTVGGGTTGLNFNAPLTATPNTTTSNVDVGMLASPTFTNLTASTLTYAPGVDVWGGAVQATYTDAGPETLATISVPVGSIVVVDFTVIGNLNTSNGAPGYKAPQGDGAWKVTARLVNASGGIGTQVALLSTLASNGAPFLPAATSSATGLVAVVGAGANALIQVNGFAAAPWVVSTAYVTGDGSSVAGSFVTANGNVYRCSTSGTSSGSAPSGTTTSGTGAVFTYMCAGAVVPVQWTLSAVRAISG